MKPVEIRDPELPPVSADCVVICLCRVFARMMALTKAGAALGWKLNDDLARLRENMGAQKCAWN